MILTGNVALESMGFETFGFAGGREDIFSPEDDVYWGPEETWLADQRYPNKLDRTSLEKPLGAVQMGLIYVNPEGPNGNPDPLLAAKDIRETFARMAMNDEETVALIAGGHTFGKCHGAGNTQNIGQEPEGAPIEYQGLGWISSYKSGKGQDAITSGLEGAWTAQPSKWDYGYFDNLFRFDWVKTKSPAGATQWIPSDASAQKLVPDAHDKSKRHPPIMLTTDLALRFDPIYGPISHKFLKNPQDFAQAFAKAWFKLTHRDMGPLSRYLGPEVPKELLLWQDPIPAPSPHSRSLTVLDLQVLKSRILASGLTISQLTRAAWASACTYRRTDHRGGANGGRVRLSPQIHWPANKPFELQKVLLALDRVKQDFGKEISMADLIILGGCAAIEAAAKKAGRGLEVPFAPGRTDASLQQTDVESFTYLEPTSDGFRNYLGFQNTRPAEELLVDRAQLLGLTAPEMTVLVGGMRVLDTSHEPGMGVLTREPGKLDNAFFINLLDMNTVWKPTRDINVFEGYDYDSHHLRWKASRVDLIFGSNSELRAIAEYYACDDCRQTFVDDFVKAWSKVMNADRFDLKATAPGRAKL
jgi:catalase-peroxidase